MKGEKDIVGSLHQMLDTNAALRNLVEQSIALAAQHNSHLRTNPVRSLDDWFLYLESFLHHMPWQTMDIGEEASFFRRIDQNIGYFYFLIDQPLDALRDKGYIYPSLQYEPQIAQWLKDYNIAWGEWLSSAESWNEDYYRLALSDTRFELASGRYESPANWHSWNDFFARKLNDKWQNKCLNGKCENGKMISPSDGVIASALVKTVSLTNWLDLLGDSPYRDVFADGETTHIVLDVFDYHRFHAPCDGTVLDCRIIQGIHAGGGVIIWDEAQGRYRYNRLGATDFQMLETRGVFVLDTPAFGKIALVPVGVQQVSSVQWAENLNCQLSTVNYQLHQGDEVGYFQFGGSDIILFFESGKAPAFQLDKSLKVGEKIC